MKLGALIPARGGSRRVPDKNIRDLHGRPLLAWTLDCLLEADCYDDVCVSTESPRIAELIRERYGAGEVRVLERPARLATDTASMQDVVAHYLESRPDLDFYSVFLPTYPFRKAETVRRICNEAHTGFPIQATSVTESTICSRDLYYPVENGIKHFFRTPEVYAGYLSACYTLNHRDWAYPLWRRQGYTANERSLTIHVGLEENIDIDTEADFETALAVAQGKRFVTRKSVMHRLPEADLLLPEGVDPTAFLNYAKDRINGSGHPILCLKAAEKPSFMFAVSSIDPRAYFCSEEARNAYIATPKIRKTTCNSEQPVHYVHSRHYRILPTDKRLAVDDLPTPRWHARDDGPTSADETVPWDNVILMDDLCEQDFYLEPTALAFPEGE